MARMHNPPHPGELIKASINELGITVTAFAEHIGVSRVALSRVLNGRASVTAMLDYRVAAAFGQTPGLWLACRPPMTFGSWNTRGCRKSSDWRRRHWYARCQL